MNKKNVVFVTIGIIAIIAVICFAALSGIMNPFEHNIQMAVKELNKGNYEEAILSFDKAALIDDGSAELFFAKANAELLEGDDRAANTSIEKALVLLKYGFDKSEKNKYLMQILNSEDYKSKSDLMVYWLENNYGNEEYNDLNVWLKEYLSSENFSEIEDIEQRIKNKETNEALKKLCEKKGVIKKVNDERRIIANTNYDEYGAPVILEDYYMNDGILSYYIDDFDRDGNDDIFTAEVKNNNLRFKLYKISNGEAIETDSKSILNLFDNFVGSADWTKIFIKDFNGEIYAFSENYMSGYLISDGYAIDIKGYLLTDGEMIEVMNESGEGSDMMEYMEEVNNILKTYELAPVMNDDFYGDTKSVAESSDVEVLATIEQRFNGTYDEVYENLDNPNSIRPMDITIDINNAH